MTPALRFNESPYHANHVGSIALEFREKGYAILYDVFERDSVGEYRAQVEAAIQTRENGGLFLPPDSPLAVAPTYAPRLRQILPPALSPALMRPYPSLFEVAWLISAGEKPQGAFHWHKDRGHEGNSKPAVYHYPNEVHIGMYFTDMTLEDGPTEVIPRSHRDDRLSPYNGSEVVPFLCRKQDMVIWDQRLWHRGTPRRTPGNRIFALFGFYPVPAYNASPYPMPPAQRAAWRAATDPAEQVFYGGIHAPTEDK